MPSEHFIFFLCVYRVVVEITRETWGKCGIKTVKHYNEKEHIIELWQKMRSAKTQTKNLKYC